MKRAAFVFMSVWIVSAVFAQSREIKQAPLNPEFIKYMKQIERGEIQHETAFGYSLGYIPPPIKWKGGIPIQLNKDLVLPTRYDLRDQGTVTSVKNQSTCGCCWAFATMGSVESRWLELGLGTYDLSEQNLKNGHGFEKDACSGGNSWMSTAYFTRGDGPVLETNDPYNPNDNTYVPGLIPVAYVSDARFLPKDDNILKQTIHDSGAVFTDMFWDEAYYNASNFTYYYNGPDTTVNHAVLLVGWDDNKSTAAGKGAWIIKNSWGTSFGENGFFYIAYNDTEVNTDPAFWPNRTIYNTATIIHYYDKLGMIGAVGYSIDTGYGLVKCVAATKQNITKLGTWVFGNNTTVSFTVYDNFNETTTTLSNVLGSIGNQLCNYSGYYTFDLPSPIAINNGNDFYVKVKYTCPGSQYPVPMEQFLKDYANPIIESGKYWLSYNGQNGTWTALGSGTSYGYDLCIKAYNSSVFDEDSKAELPSTFVLYQNRPNPFNSTTRIAYSLPTSQHVVLKVYDLSGREVATLVDEWKALGNYGVDFNAGHLPSGMYVYRIKAGDFVQARKLMLLK